MSDYPYPESQGHTQPDVISHDLLILSRDMRDVLPHERRSTIYDFIFDPPTVKDVHGCALSASRGATSMSPESWPSHINPANIDFYIRHEIVAHFFRLNTNIEISHPIGLFRNFQGVNDIFDTYIRPKLHMLPALVVGLRFVSAEAFEAETDKLVRSFVLTLRIDTSVFESSKRRSSYDYQRCKKSVREFVDCQKNLYPSFCGVKTALESCKKKVVFFMRAETLNGVLTFHVQAHMMAWDARAWWDYVFAQLLEEH